MELHLLQNLQTPDQEHSTDLRQISGPSSADFRIPGRDRTLDSGVGSRLRGTRQSGSGQSDSRWPTDY